MSIRKYTSEMGYVLYIATGFILAFQQCWGESCPNRGDIRLQNGANNYEGRVEVCGSTGSGTDQTLIWRTVCNAGWDINEARVVCRQLGFSGNQNPVPITNGTFRDHNSQNAHIDFIIKKNFTCKGDEDMLLSCTYYNRNPSYCNESESRMKPAGVYCFGQINEQNRCNDNEIRLSNGTGLNNASGRVEVCLGGLWGTVCDHGWTTNDANTVCRQLGYNHGRAIPTRAAYFGEGSGPIHLSRAQCGTRDTKLTNCIIDKTGINGCDHSDDAGVICMGSSSCEDGDLRLVGGESEREGRVEICYNGVWGTVCTDGWDEVDANVVCQQLGITYQRALPINDSRFGAVDHPVQLNNVSCSKEHLSQCVSFPTIDIQHRCNHTAGLICIASTDQLPTTTFYVSTTNLSHDSTYKSHDTTSTAPGSSTIRTVVGAACALAITVVIIVVITVMLIARLRLKTNSHMRVNENIAYGEVSHRTINASKDECGDIGMEENVSYGQVHCRSTIMFRNEAYGVFPITKMSNSYKH